MSALDVPPLKQPLAKQQQSSATANKPSSITSPPLRPTSANNNSANNSYAAVSGTTTVAVAATASTPTASSIRRAPFTVPISSPSQQQSTQHSALRQHGPNKSKKKQTEELRKHYRDAQRNEQKAANSSSIFTAAAAAAASAKKSSPSGINGSGGSSSNSASGGSNSSSLHSLSMGSGHLRSLSGGSTYNNIIVSDSASSMKKTPSLRSKQQHQHDSSSSLLAAQPPTSPLPHSPNTPAFSAQLHQPLSSPSGLSLASSSSSSNAAVAAARSSGGAHTHNTNASTRSKSKTKSTTVTQSHRASSNLTSNVKGGSLTAPLHLELPAASHPIQIPLQGPSMATVYSHPSSSFSFFKPENHPSAAASASAAAAFKKLPVSSSPSSLKVPDTYEPYLGSGSPSSLVSNITAAHEQPSDDLLVSSLSSSAVAAAHSTTNRLKQPSPIMLSEHDAASSLAAAKLSVTTVPKELSALDYLHNESAHLAPRQRKAAHAAANAIPPLSSSKTNSDQQSQHDLESIDHEYDQLTAVQAASIRYSHPPPAFSQVVSPEPSAQQEDVKMTALRAASLATQKQQQDQQQMLLLQQQQQQIKEQQIQHQVQQHLQQQQQLEKQQLEQHFQQLQQMEQNQAKAVLKAVQLQKQQQASKNAQSQPAAKQHANNTAATAASIAAANQQTVAPAKEHTPSPQPSRHSSPALLARDDSVTPTSLAFNHPEQTVLYSPTPIKGGSLNHIPLLHHHNTLPDIYIQDRTTVARSTTLPVKQKSSTSAIATTAAHQNQPSQHLALPSTALGAHSNRSTGSLTTPANNHHHLTLPSASVPKRPHSSNSVDSVGTNGSTGDDQQSNISHSQVHTAATASKSAVARKPVKRTTLHDATTSSMTSTTRPVIHHASTLPAGLPTQQTVTRSVPAAAPQSNGKSSVAPQLPSASFGQSHNWLQRPVSFHIGAGVGSSSSSSSSATLQPSAPHTGFKNSTLRQHSKTKSSSHQGIKSTPTMPLPSPSSSLFADFDKPFQESTLKPVSKVLTAPVLAGASIGHGLASAGGRILAGAAYPLSQMSHYNPPLAAATPTMSSTSTSTTLGPSNASVPTLRTTRNNHGILSAVKRKLIPGQSENSGRGGGFSSVTGDATKSGGGSGNGALGAGGGLEDIVSGGLVKTTMRKHSRRRSFNEDKPWKHHSDAAILSDAEKRRYEGLWASNRGVHLKFIYQHLVTEEEEEKDEGRRRKRGVKGEGGDNQMALLVVKNLGTEGNEESADESEEYEDEDEDDEEDFDESPLATSDEDSDSEEDDEEDDESEEEDGVDDDGDVPVNDLDSGIGLGFRGPSSFSYIPRSSDNASSGYYEEEDEGEESGEAFGNGSASSSSVDSAFASAGSSASVSSHVNNKSDAEEPVSHTPSHTTLKVPSSSDDDQALKQLKENTVPSLLRVTSPILEPPSPSLPHHSDSPQLISSAASAHTRHSVTSSHQSVYLTACNSLRSSPSLSPRPIDSPHYEDDDPLSRHHAMNNIVLSGGLEIQRAQTASPTLPSRHSSTVFIPTGTEAITNGGVRSLSPGNVSSLASLKRASSPSPLYIQSVSNSRSAGTTASSVGDGHSISRRDSPVLNSPSYRNSVFDVPFESMKTVRPTSQRALSNSSIQRIKSSFRSMSPPKQRRQQAGEEWERREAEIQTQLNLQRQIRPQGETGKQLQLQSSEKTVILAPSSQALATASSKESSASLPPQSSSPANPIAKPLSHSDATDTSNTATTTTKAASSTSTAGPSSSLTSNTLDSRAATRKVQSPKISTYYRVEHDPKEDIHGYIVRELWRRSRLSDTTLAQIWSLVDRNHDGSLDREGFLVGMWLVDQCLYGRKLPHKIDDAIWRSVSRLGVTVEIIRKKQKRKKQRAQQKHLVHVPHPSHHHHDHYVVSEAVCAELDERRTAKKQQEREDKKRKRQMKKKKKQDSKERKAIRKLEKKQQRQP